MNIIKGKLLVKGKLSPKQDDKTQNLAIKDNNIAVAKSINESIQESREMVGALVQTIRRLSQVSLRLLLFLRYSVITPLLYN